MKFEVTALKTKQSALLWRKSFESALFRHARKHWRQNEAQRRGIRPEDVQDGPSEEEWTTLRCCIPIDRVTIQGIQDFHSFMTLVGLDVELNDRQTLTWHPEHVAQGDFSGNDGSDRLPTRTTHATDLAKTVNGLDVPTRSSSSRMDSIPAGKDRSRDESVDAKPRRSYSLKPSFPFVGSNRESIRDSSPDRPRSDHLKPIQRQSSVWIDSGLPPRLARGPTSESLPGYEPSADRQPSFDFNIAILNEQSWFIEALKAAVAAGRDRRYRPHVERPKVSFELAGNDCLATDEDMEEEGALLRRSSATSSQNTEEAVEDATDPERQASREIRKTEKATMAAKMFGLKENEGIWRE